MAVQVVDYQETYKLICDDCRRRWAVVEERCGKVYSLDAHHARHAPNTPEGMEEVVEPDGWCDEMAARRCFEEAVKGERYYSQILW
ncbi:MAG: hypothetical protein HYU60_03605 [Magnetospirillum sp.]|nr:hypothetical protein [Magnetospirillum sp.]